MQYNIPLYSKDFGVSKDFGAASEPSYCLIIERASADDWPWSSWCRSELADPCPVEVEVNWLAQVDEPLSASQMASIRESVNRQRPFGASDWQTKVASRFGLESTMRPRADPR